MHVPTMLLELFMLKIHIREEQRGNQEWTIYRQWQHWVHKTQDEDKEMKHNSETLEDAQHGPQQKLGMNPVARDG